MEKYAVVQNVQLEDVSAERVEVYVHEGLMLLSDALNIAQLQLTCHNNGVMVSFLS